MPASSRSCWIASVACLAACATVPEEAGFGDVQADVRERTGLEIHWSQLEAEGEIAERVAQWLATELTAERAVQIALLNNRELQATYQELGIAQADLVAAGLVHNPVFSAEVRFPEGGGQVDLDFSVAQEFLGVFFIPLRKRIASARFDAVKLRVAGEVLDLAGRARGAFCVHEAACQLLELRRTVLAATEASYELAQRLHAAGNLRDLDLAGERALREQARVEVAAAELEVAESREALNALLGLWGEATRWSSAGRLPPVPEEAVALEGIEGRAIAQSLELGLARAEMERVAQSLGLARSSRWTGELELGVAAERDDGTWSIGPTAALPLPLFDQGQPAIARATAELRGLEDRYMASAISIRSEVRALASRLSMLQAKERHIRLVLLPLHQQIVEETQKEFNAMQVGAFQLLQAKQQEIVAGTAYVETVRDYWLATAGLEQLASGGRPRFDSGRGAAWSAAAGERGGHASSDRAGGTR
jgi:cobalt-zinc-cadmium efflux system outer membrane protein